MTPAIALPCLLAMSLLMALPAGASAWDAAKARWFLHLPVSREMRLAAEGSVSVNLVKARYFLYAESEASECRKLAAQLGWKPSGDLTGTVPTPAGEMSVAAWHRAGEGRMLLLALSEEGGGLAVMALFDRRPSWVGDDGEAPGRELAGVPRIASARRLLHLAGPTFEGAWYASPAGEAEVLASARAGLASRGWSVESPRSGILFAYRPGCPGVTLFARPAGEGTDFFVLASRREN